MRAGVLLRAFDIDHDETLIRFDSFDAGSAFKTEVQRIAGTGTVPFLVDTSLRDSRGQALTITDTLSIVEYIAETFADHAIWPKARNLCVEMHCGFGALRQYCMMNICPALKRLSGATKLRYATMLPRSRPLGPICWICQAGHVWQVTLVHWMAILPRL